MRGKTFSLVFGGVSCGACLIFLYLSSVMPNHFTMLVVAGFFPMLVMMKSHFLAGVYCWAASSILAIVLLPQKSVALMFACCFGIYPLIKLKLEEMKIKFALLLRFLYANTCLVLYLSIFSVVILEKLPEGFKNQLWIAFLLGNIVFFIYDVALSQVIPKIQHRIRQILL